MKKTKTHKLMRALYAHLKSWGDIDPQWFEEPTKEDFKSHSCKTYDYECYICNYNELFKTLRKIK